MSIIIRLQNLPWSANSSDIRHFFGSLEIPEGGVHIIGGNKGDAFIAFRNDEDARLAMQKNGQRLKSARVSLYLSSRSELQLLVDEVRKGGLSTKGESPEPPHRSKERQRSVEPLPRRRTPERSRWKSPPRRSARSRSRSPVQRGERGFDSESHHHFRQDTHSRAEYRTSPSRKHGGHPRAHHSADFSGERQSGQKYRDPFRESVDELETDNTTRRSPPNHLWKPEVKFIESAQLYDRRSPDNIHRAADDVWDSGYKLQNQPPNVFSEFGSKRVFSKVFENRASDLVRKESVESGFPRNQDSAHENYASHQQNLGEFSPPKNFQDFRKENFARSGIFPFQAHSLPAEDVMNVPQFPEGRPSDNRFKDWRRVESFHQESRVPGSNEMGQQKGAFGFGGIASSAVRTDHPMQNHPFPPSAEFSRRNIPPEMHKSERFDVSPNCCLRVSGLNPNATFKDVQSVLKGVFAPQRYIKWDMGIKGNKTKTAYVKMSNIDDFYSVLQQKQHFLDSVPVNVSKCPDDIYEYMFPPEFTFRSRAFARNSDLCYMLEGLPFATTENDIINFFEGFNLVDFLILYDKKGKATGTGFVEFGTPDEYCQAYVRNGKKIGHRYVELFKASHEDVEKARKTAISVSKPMRDILNQNTSGGPFNCAPQRRPVCVVLAGLPQTIRNTQIFAFFNECGIRPHAVHIILNDFGHPNGRAFVEFLDPFDFDIALKQHGKTIDENTISIKQVLYEEMSNILAKHKALHNFGVSKPEKRNRCPPTEPEKVPYLWEPPDATEGSHMCQQKKMSWGDAEGGRPPLFSWETPGFREKTFPPEDRSFKREEFPRNSMYGTEIPNHRLSNYESRLQGRDFVRPTTAQQDLYSDFDGKSSADFRFHGSNDAFFGPRNMSHEPFMNRSFDRAPEQQVNDGQRFGALENRYEMGNQQLSALGIPEGLRIEASVADDRDRAPIKFGMKGRQQVSGSSMLSDYFDSNKEEEESKRKLQKLSPDKMITSETLIKNDMNISSNSAHKINVEPKSNSKLLPNVSTKPSDNGDEKNHRPESGLEKSTSSNSRGRQQRSSRSYADKRSESLREKENPSPAKHDVKDRSRSGSRNGGRNPRSPVRRQHDTDRFNSQDSNNPDSGPMPSHMCPAQDDMGTSVIPFVCNGRIIQADNVHPEIGLDELLFFFRGYRLRGEDIIRRFTDHGEPTGDVRIAFESPLEAKCAMQCLNHQPLRGIPINLFFI